MHSGDRAPLATLATARPERPSLLSIVTAPDYASRVSEAVARIADADDAASAQHLLGQCVETLGAQSAFFASFVRDSADVSACHFMLACEPGWCRRYLDSGGIARDPWLAYAANHTEPLVASALPINDLAYRDIIDLAQQSGFVSAVLVPAHSGPGHSRISLLTFGSPDEGFFEGEGFGRFRLGARALAAELHDWWMARLRRELVTRVGITPVELELLQHERRGHSSKHIARALNISESAVNSRFQRMNSKLGTPNRRAAARLALECGLLPF